MSRIAVLIAAMLTTIIASPAPAATDAEKCGAAKNKIARKYQQCRATAEARAILDASTPNYSKCVEAFTRTWSKADAKFGAACADHATLASMQELIDQHTKVVADLIGGIEEIPFCGDGKINVAGEQCDGADLGGATCATLGMPLGVLACANCILDTRGCINVTFPSTGVTTSHVMNDDGATRAGGSLAYTHNGDGTITDERTGLMWSMQIAQNGVGNPTSALDADNCHPWWGLCMGDPHLAKCTVDADCGANGPCQPGWSHACQDTSPPLTAFQLIAILNQIGFAGYDDWRLPNIKELESIVDFSRAVPAAHPAFHGESCGPTCVDANPACACTAFIGAGCAEHCTHPSCQCVEQGPFYWSSTTHHRTVEEGGWGAFGLEFHDGVVWSAHKHSALRVRAVRGGR